MSYQYLLTLCLILASTKVLSIATGRLQLPQVVGSLLAGLLLGPAVLPAAVVAMAAGGMAALARGERDFALGPWLSACCLAALLGIAIAGAVG